MVYRLTTQNRSRHRDRRPRLYENTFDRRPRLDERARAPPPAAIGCPISRTHLPAAAPREGDFRADAARASAVRRARPFALAHKKKRAAASRRGPSECPHALSWCGSCRRCTRPPGSSPARCSCG
jgi:hypothetical protein